MSKQEHNPDSEREATGPSRHPLAGGWEGYEICRSCRKKRLASMFLTPKDGKLVGTLLIEHPNGHVSKDSATVTYDKNTKRVTIEFLSIETPHTKSSYDGWYESNKIYGEWTTDTIKGKRCYGSFRLWREGISDSDLNRIAEANPILIEAPLEVIGQDSRAATAHRPPWESRLLQPLGAN